MTPPPGVGSATDASFGERVLASETPVLVDFWAAWCAPCKQLSPVVAALGAEFAGRLRVLAVDVDSNPGLVARYGIRSIPQLLLFSGGTLVKTIVGARPRSLILREIEPHIGAADAV